jgi:hypothetical protein
MLIQVHVSIQGIPDQPRSQQQFLRFTYLSIMREDKRRAVGLANPFPIFDHLVIGYAPKVKDELYLQYREPIRARLRKSMHPTEEDRRFQLEPLKGK